MLHNPCTCTRQMDVPQSNYASKHYDEVVDGTVESVLANRDSTSAWVLSNFFSLAMVRVLSSLAGFSASTDNRNSSYSEQTGAVLR
eukprot:m.60052 g.60052  ORF g.60052 m.60052 type:complete len:86 (+) comp11797_c1_seq1:428-685(+)